MKKFYLVLFFLAAGFYAKTQQVVTFEDVRLKPDSYYNGSDGAGGFFSGDVWFPNVYNAEWGGAWSGFSVSNMNDTKTATYENQFSSVTGKGADDSGQYAVVYFSGELNLKFDNPVTVKGFDVTNSTLCYLMMRDGDSNGFSKKFGGKDGKDPDYFKLMVWGTGMNDKKTDTLEFFLADFRFENNEKDYLVNNWKWFDLTSIGVVKELHFGMESSDTGEWGMNTPAYFCVDNLKIEKEITSDKLVFENRLEPVIYPNPVKGSFFIGNFHNNSGSIVLTESTGKIIFKQEISGIDKLQIDALNKYPAGVYFLKIETGPEVLIRKILKN